MTQADDIARRSGPGSVLTALIMFLAMVILGPPLGGLILAGGLLVAMEYGPDPFRLPAGPVDWPNVILIALGITYLAGGIQAIFVAMAAAFSQLYWHSSRACFWSIVVASTIAGAGYLIVTTTATQPVPPIHVILFFLGVHVGAGIGCWLIVTSVMQAFRSVPSVTGANP